MQLAIDALRDALATSGSALPDRDAEIFCENNPLRDLRTKLGLSDTEERVLAVLAAHELCPEARQLVRELNSEPLLDPTLDTIRRVVYRGAHDERAWRELSEGGAVHRLGLVEWIEADAPNHRTTLRLASRVLALVHGVVEIDPQLAGCATLDVPVVPLAALEIAGNRLAHVDDAIGAGGLVVVCGSSGSGRRSLLSGVAAKHGHTVLQVHCRLLPTEREVARRMLRWVARECRLLGRVPLLVHLDALGAAGEVPDRVDLVEAELEGLVLATSCRPLARRWRCPPSTIELLPLPGAQHATLWSRALPEASAADAELLATLYPLAPALVDAVGTVARREAAGVAMAPAHIETGIRTVLDDRLAGLAKRLEVTQTWDDLVLPDDQTSAVVELLARIRRRRRVYEDWGFANKVGKGLGVSALFSGPPGTGKTMCAGLVAKDLRLEVYQVDVSKISSKWIGETEKNLGALFDAAEAGHAILLFDEADALFGKRTQVTTSNDHHANQQVNYLLQRLEAFTGVCVLTTNHDTALDEAFRRRLSMHVRFPVPDADEREKLWRAMLPAAAPVAPDPPFAMLARKYVMSGGYIRNAVLRAAFLAADEDQLITALHFTLAAQLEYEAMGKLASAA
jgi:ATPase family associated with various cellular activities (AAA)